jgi:ketosteroid isomerase-like protein
MTRPVTAVCLALTLIASTVLFAQSTGSTANTTSPPDKSRLEAVLAAWASMDPSRAAGFYAKDPNAAFFDIAPRKYTGWAEYEKGTAALFATVKSLTLKLADDAQLHRAGNVTWTTATVDGEMINKDGSSMKVDARWTTVWEKRAGKWLIVHEHFSMPLPEPAAKPTAAARVQ